MTALENCRLYSIEHRLPYIGNEKEEVFMGRIRRKMAEDLIASVVQTQNERCSRLKVNRK